MGYYSRLKAIVVMTALGVWPAETAHAREPAAELDDACYQSIATVEQKADFVRRLVPLAVDSEERFGVPAPAIAAIAILESGFGQTRLARESGNYFAWKATRSTAGAYVLTCQPITDENNRYYRFDSLAKSVEFVARRLRDSSAYGPITRRYNQDLAEGRDPQFAIYRWLDNVATKYNPTHAEDYRAKLRRIINDPLRWSSSFDSNTSLMRHAKGASVNATNKSVAYQAAISAMGEKLDPGGRTMDLCDIGSGDVFLRFPSYENLPVTGCSYVVKVRNGVDLRGFAYTLHPTGGQVALWIANACLSQPQLDQASCARYLFSTMYESNNVQYVVAGDAVEDGKGGNCSPASTLFHIQFRDGVAVQLPNRNFCTPGAIDFELLERDVWREPDVTYFVARVAAISLAKFEKYSNMKLPRSSKWSKRAGDYHAGVEWREQSRRAYIDALQTDHYLLLNYQAADCAARSCVRLAARN